MREKLETDTKIKQEELTQRRSEQQKIADQQNNILQQMQLQQVNQRQEMQDMLAAFMQQSHQQTKLCWQLWKNLLKNRIKLSRLRIAQIRFFIAKYEFSGFCTCLLSYKAKIKHF